MKLFIIYYFCRLSTIFSNLLKIGNVKKNAVVSSCSKVNSPYVLINCSIDRYSYVGSNSNISNTDIGKFCSIGANFFCGGGIHPTNGLSTAPFFYSELKQCGSSICREGKFEEFKKTVIGNDVFVGANVTILSGVHVGDGSIIGAGTVVSKNVPPYAIVVGSPMSIFRYRFENEVIESLLEIQWWNWNLKKLALVEKYFFDVEKFIQISKKQNIEC